MTPHYHFVYLDILKFIYIEIAVVSIMVRFAVILIFHYGISTVVQDIFKITNVIFEFIKMVKY